MSMLCYSLHYSLISSFFVSNIFMATSSSEAAALHHLWLLHLQKLLLCIISSRNKLRCIIKVVKNCYFVESNCILEISRIIPLCELNNKCLHRYTHGAHTELFIFCLFFLSSYLPFNFSCLPILFFHLISALSFFFVQY